MANTLGNRVKMSVSGTPGTGTITLGSAVSGFQTFAAAGIPNAATVPYVIEDGSNWEIGVGTYTSSGTTLARTSITASSNSGSAISATSSAIVMISPLAADLQSTDTLTSGTLGTARGGTGLSSYTSGYLPYASSSSTLASNSGLLSDGTNLGVGVVPFQWNSGARALHIHNALSLFAATSSPIGFISNNHAWTAAGGDVYIVGGAYASYYKQYNGAHIWATTTSTQGAGNAISFTTPMTLDGSGYLLVGYNSSNGAYKLQVNSQIFATSSTIATSDANYKENVEPLTGALAMVQALNPVTFNWKPHQVHAFDTQHKTTGFLAQEVQIALADQPFISSLIKQSECVLEPAEYETVILEPEVEEVVDAWGNIITDGKPAVTEQVLVKEAVTEPFLGIAEGNMIAILTAAIKELKAEFDAYKASHP